MATTARPSPRTRPRRLKRSAGEAGRAGNAKSAAPVASGGSRAQMSRHLNGLATAIRLRMREGLLARGHDLRPSTSQVIPNLPPEGLRMTDLASRLRLTLQRAGQLVGELEEVGYLERVPDPDDGRARRVVYTRRGRALIGDIEAITAETTALFSERLGTARFERLCALLAELDVAIHGPDAPVRVVGAGYEVDES